MKLFSIITINYNNLRGLQHTVESVQIQSNFEELQWILIDGGSTDGSVEYIEETKAKMSRRVEIISLSEKDKGIYDAMNKGLSLATGQYVWFLNSGDSLHSSLILSKLADKLHDVDSLPDVVYGDTMFVDEERNNLGLISKKKPQRYPQRLHGGSFRFGMNICHQSFLAKREIVSEYDLNYKQASDIDWIIGVLKRSKSSLDAKIVISDFEVGGSSYQYTKKAWKERYQVLEKHYGKIPNFLAHIWIFCRRGIFYIQGKLFGKR